MTTTIGRTVLLCRDLDASAAFWADGFGFRTLFQGETEGFPLLHVGPGRVDEPGLWLVPLPEGGAPLARPGRPTLGRDVAARAPPRGRRAAAGGEPVGGPDADAETGDRFAHVHDPDGHRVVVVQLGTTTDPA